MNNNISISILVPVYKVEDYLRRCIESVLKQFFLGCELILVDDGSPDNCPAICDEYKTKYSEFIKVIHKKNGGLPSARLAGFEAAEGEYIMFLDSDDYLLDGALNNLYNTIKCGYDIVRGIITREDVLTHQRWTEEYELDGKCINDNSLYFHAVMTQRIPPYLHSGIYRKKLFSKEYFKILIDENISIGEDWILNVAISPNVKSFCSINTPCYCYSVNHDSMIYTSIYSYKKHETVEKVLNIISKNFPKEYKRLILSNRLSTYIKCFFTPELGFSKRHYHYIKEFISEKNNYQLLKTHTDPRYLRYIKNKRIYCIYSKLFCLIYFCLKLKFKRRNVIQ